MIRGPFAQVMAACIGDGAYMMPEELLPDANCEKCKYDKLPHDGGHCYMFESKPGKKCGQFKEM